MKGGGRPAVAAGAGSGGRPLRAGGVWWTEEGTWEGAGPGGDLEERGGRLGAEEGAGSEERCLY